jgi:tetratricopeptide (TPR) repeat protein
MENATPQISGLVLRRVRHELNNWIRALQQGASALGDYSARAANELEYSSRAWSRTNDEIQSILEKSDELSFAQIDRLLSLMPPERAILRYHLERLTPVYRELCRGPRVEVEDMMNQAESAIDRGDYEIGLNVLEHLLRIEPRFYPAMLLKGVTLMRSSRGRPESIRLFEQAIQAAPVRAQARYKQLAMELLATTHQLDDQPKGAIKTFKRIRGLDIEDPAIDYNIAKNYATTGQTSDALNSLKLAIDGRHLLLSLSLVDKDFTNVRKGIVQILEEENELWGERAVQVLNRGKEIIKLARQYKLDKRDRTISRGITAFEEMDGSMEEGCYSVYRKIIVQQMPRWSETVLAAIDKHMHAEIQDRRDRVDRHNDAVQKTFAKRRSTFLAVGVPLWMLFSAIVFLLALSNGSGTVAGLLSSGITLAIGIIPFMVVNNFLTRGLHDKTIDPAEIVGDSRRESEELHKVGRSLISSLRESGVEVDGKKVSL